MGVRREWSVETCLEGKAEEDGAAASITHGALHPL